MMMQRTSFTCGLSAGDVPYKSPATCTALASVSGGAAHPAASVRTAGMERSSAEQRARPREATVSGGGRNLRSSQAAGASCMPRGGHHGRANRLGQTEQSRVPHA